MGKAEDRVGNMKSCRSMFLRGWRLGLSRVASLSMTLAQNLAPKLGLKRSQMQGTRDRIDIDDKYQLEGLYLDIVEPFLGHRNLFKVSWKPAMLNDNKGIKQRYYPPVGLVIMSQPKGKPKHWRKESFCPPFGDIDLIDWARIITPAFSASVLSFPFKIIQRSLQKRRYMMSISLKCARKKSRASCANQSLLRVALVEAI